VTELLYQNRRNIQVFSADWFKLWQTALLFALNKDPVIGRDLRQALGIPSEFEGAWITLLLPNCFHCYNGESNRIAVFYSRQPLADNLYKNYKNLWNLFHLWDLNFANKIPRLAWANLGFDSLTAYPQAGKGGSNTTTDASIYENSYSSSFDEARLGRDLIVDNSNILYLSCNYYASSYYIYRYFATIETTSILAAYSLNSISFSFYISQNMANYLPNGNIHAVTHSSSSNNTFTTSDWDKINFNTKGYWNNDNTNGMKTISLNNSIIVPGGITKLALIYEGDLNNIAPTGETLLYGNTADASINKPYLTIGYSLPGKGSQMLV